MKSSSEPFTVPFRIVIDSQEKHPYRFQGLRGNAILKNRPLVVPTVQRYLKTGDYTIEGFEKHTTVERKSLDDLYQTLGQGRDRFEREHKRMAAMGAGATMVVIEAGWDDVLLAPPVRSRLKPKTIIRTAIAWYQRYSVPWFAAGNRGIAEAVTYRFLERFYYDLIWELSKKDGRCRGCGRELSSHRSTSRGLGPVCAMLARYKDVEL